MTISIMAMNWHISDKVDESREGKKEEQLSPSFSSSGISDGGEYRVNRERIKIGNQVLHGRLKIELSPHLSPADSVDKFLIRSPYINGNIGND